MWITSLGKENYSHPMKSLVLICSALKIQSSSHIDTAFRESCFKNIKASFAQLETAEVELKLKLDACSLKSALCSPIVIPQETQMESFQLYFIILPCRSSKISLTSQNYHSPSLSFYKIWQFIPTQLRM